MSRILVVDDERDIAELLAEVLADEGYLTRHVFSGRAAIDELASFSPHAVLLDLWMPEVDGFEVAAEIQGLPSTTRPLVILMSGMGGVASHAERIGADSYISKPFDVPRLLTILRGLSLPPTAITAGTA